jgi:iron complex outermembrane receptor protein
VDVWETWSQIPEEYEQTDISFSPSITASNEFRYSPLKGLNLILASNFVGRQYVDNTQSVERSIDPYLVHDFKILYDVKVKALKKLQFKLSINNVLNHQYETNAWVYRYIETSGGDESLMSGYYPQAGINFMGGIKIGI